MEPLTRQQIARKQDWMDRYLRARRREALTARTLEEARSAAARVSPVLDGMPRPGGHSDRVPLSAERLAEAEHAHNIALAEMRQARGEVQQAVGSVRDRTGREVLYRRYLLGQPLLQVSQEMMLEYRWVRRLHRRAVEAAVQTGDAAA